MTSKEYFGFDLASVEVGDRVRCPLCTGYGCQGCDGGRVKVTSRLRALWENEYEQEKHH